MQRSTLLSLDDMPATTSLELDRAPTPASEFQRTATPRPVQFGNLTIRPVDETPPVAPREMIDVSRVRACPKCRFNASLDDTACPKCGVIFAKMRFDAPRAVEPIHLDVGMEEKTSAYELRVLSIVASLTFIALMLSPNVAKDANAELIMIAGMFQLGAFLTWVGARAYEWGTKNGAVGIIVLFFTTGWLWPLFAKPVSWIAGLVGVNLPRATGWIVTGIALATSIAVAGAR
jgi:hypothetical protein